MAIAFAAAGTVTTGNSVSSLSLSSDASTTTTDVLVAIIEQAGGAGLTWTAPAGWIKQVDVGTSTNTIGLGVFTKIAPSAGTNTSSFTLSNKSSMRGVILRYSGADQTTLMDVAATSSANTAGTTSDTVTGGITPVTNGAMVVFGVAHAANTALSTPTGYTNRLATGVDPSNSHENAAWDLLQTTAGNTTPTSTASASAQMVAALVALRPASAGGTPAVELDHLLVLGCS